MTDLTIREMLESPTLSLTPAEGSIVRILLSEYPSAGLGSASALARRAGVSDPTVLRLVSKLGFQGFGEFQARLLAEVEARLHSPLMMMEAKRLPGVSVSARFYHSVAEAVESLSALPGEDVTLSQAANLIMATRGKVYLLGGRFSCHLAGFLSGYIQQFRSDVVELGEVNARVIDQLVDISRTDTLIVFDYRRYQNDTIRFAEAAAARGAKLIVFTDPWGSPVAQGADLVLRSAVEAQSPFDTMAPALAQVEALVAHMVAAVGPERRKRIEELDAIRAAHAVTIDIESGRTAGLEQASDKSGERTP